MIRTSHSYLCADVIGHWPSTIYSEIANILDSFRSRKEGRKEKGKEGGRKGKGRQGTLFKWMFAGNKD